MLLEQFVHNITFVTGLQVKLLKEMLKPNKKRKRFAVYIYWWNYIYAENYFSLDFFTTPVKC